MTERLQNRQTLRPQHDPRQLAFQTTDELDEITETVGQQRALEALHFAVQIKHQGYNLFVLGPPGYGKRSTVKQVLQRESEGQRPGWDWCYVHNFSNPQSPTALRMAAGKGAKLKDDMANLVEELNSALPAIMDSDEYRERIQQLDDSIQKEQEKDFQELEKEAEQEGLTIVRTGQGWTVAPVKDKKLMSDEAYHQLPEDKKQHLDQRIREIRRKLENLLEEIPRWQKYRREQEKQIQREFTEATVKPMFEELKKRYQDNQKVIEYLDTVHKDVIDNARGFLQKGQHGQSQMAMMQAQAQDPSSNYYVNVLVDHSKDEGVPIIYEDNPTFNRLIGRVEYATQYGALVTDYTLIRAGALHKANGGYLVLDMRRLLMQPYAWDALKRSLFAQKIDIESVGQTLGLVNTVSLEPEPIPLDVKVVLIGDRMLYYLANQVDPDFRELFKVAADFEEKVSRTEDNVHLYAQLMATLVKKENLLPLTKEAVAAALDRTVRLSGDATKLSTHMRGVTDLLCEADYWARESGHQYIEHADIDQAVDKQIYRLSRLRDEMYEHVERDILMLSVDGSQSGQINGLSVISVGDYQFGHPTRITATARLGGGEVLDIQREVDMAGATHSKGVLIMTGYLKGRYLTTKPLSLSASLVFEQTYGVIDGDSASLAELCVLLSAISDVAVYQNLAVTGSVSQLGYVQPIGGVNEKIEGFYDICQRKGLTGDQGVLIPTANKQHLMLREDVAQAVHKGRFHIYPVSTVDDALSLLTGSTVGERQNDNRFPEGSLNHRVEKRLEQMADWAKKERLPHSNADQ